MGALLHFQRACSSAAAVSLASRVGAARPVATTRAEIRAAVKRMLAESRVSGCSDVYTSKRVRLKAWIVRCFRW